MTRPVKLVISASRRTDIPAFYMDWFMRQIEKGSFSVIHPYTQKTYEVPAGPDQVDTIVFWSKNMGPFINGHYGEILRRKGYQLFFNLTVNSESTLLEPMVPKLDERLSQVAALCRLFGSERIRWRFDPICFYRDHAGQIRNNMNDLKKIADNMADVGIAECITSFVDLYAKVQRRAKQNPSVTYIELDCAEKIRTLLEMERLLLKRGIHLCVCCEQAAMDALPPSSGITAAGCIPNDRLMALGGGRLSLKRDTGQRIKHGCSCMVSKDIGSYRLHPCYHNCHFCYANPAAPQNGQNGNNELTLCR